MSQKEVLKILQAIFQQHQTLDLKVEHDRAISDLQCQVAQQKKKYWYLFTLTMAPEINPLATQI